MNQDNLDKVKSNQVLDMITVANDFCLFTEHITGKVLADVAGYYQKVLPLLYLKGSLLPELEPSDDSANQKYVTEEHWQEIFHANEELFGKHDRYWFANENNDMVKESLSDNIADIYQDLKDFVLLFQDARLASKENAVADLKHLFITHWGRRIPKALNQLHLILFNDIINDENIDF